jgi:hypothetical protein
VEAGARRAGAKDVIRKGSQSDYAALEVMREKFPHIWQHIQYEAQGPWLDLQLILAGCEQFGEQPFYDWMKMMSRKKWEEEMGKATLQNPTLQSGPSES